MALDEDNVLDAAALSLKDWLHLLSKPPSGKVFTRCAFPTDRHHDEFLSTLAARSDADFFLVLRNFLVRSGTFGMYDDIQTASLPEAQKNAPELFARMIRQQYFQRLLLRAQGHNVDPWEGNTWILDLLPHFPAQAIEGISAYVMAHAQILPDLRLSGLWDAAELIRARYISAPHTVAEHASFLLTQSPRTIEHLVECLYSKLGYETELTPPTKDGGRDVIATRNDPTRRERLLIECKRHAKHIGAKDARALLGIVSDEKANKGVIVSVAGFTRGTRDLSSRNRRIELIDGSALTILFNEHLGPGWSLRIDRFVAESAERNRKSK